MKENRNMRDTEMFDGEDMYIIIHNYVKLQHARSEIMKKIPDITYHVYHHTYAADTGHMYHIYNYIYM
jgi:hypothetical protein